MYIYWKITDSKCFKGLQITIWKEIAKNQINKLIIQLKYLNIVKITFPIFAERRLSVEIERIGKDFVEIKNK